MSDVNAEKAINFIRDKAGEFAKAKADRVQIEEYRKTKKALLIKSAPRDYKTVQERESYAYAHDEYIQLLDALHVAVETEERLRYQIKAAELKFEMWRTNQANTRAERQRYNA